MFFNSCVKEPPITKFEASQSDIPFYIYKLLVYTDNVKDTGAWSGYTHHTFQIPEIDTISTSHLKVWYKISDSYSELKNDNSLYSYHKEGSTLSVKIFVFFGGSYTVNIKVAAWH